MSGRLKFGQENTLATESSSTNLFYSSLWYVSDYSQLGQTVFS